MGHHDDAIGDGERLLLVVGDVDDGEGERPLKLADVFADPPAQLRVEIAERLVEEEDPGLEHEGASHRHPLLLPA